ncbi:MAG: NAD-dependent malic enzyme, partial [Elusimicrobia bacterium]|nr:NAD-dependent malic enzyme [Elusimicrobiota bacterium]
DDIQGTAAVALAGLYSSGRITGRPITQEKILFHGAGEAAVGIGGLIVSALMAEGVPRSEAMSKCWFVDTKGLVVESRTDLQAHKLPFAHSHPPVGSLAAAVRDLKPTVLIGVSGRASQFSREIVEEMARLNDRPVIFALSNPTANAECTAEQAYGWSGGRAIFASGSPFASVSLGGRTFVPGQGNNAYIFPGVGLGVVVSGASRVTDEMFFESAKALAACVTEEDLATGCLFPPLTRIRDVSARIALAVARVAYAHTLAREAAPKDILEHLRKCQYQPTYKNYA